MLLELCTQDMQTSLTEPQEDETNVVVIHQFHSSQISILELSHSSELKVPCELFYCQEISLSHFPVVAFSTSSCKHPISTVALYKAKERF